MTHLFAARARREIHEKMHEIIFNILHFEFSNSSVWSVSVDNLSFSRGRTCWNLNMLTLNSSTRSKPHRFRRFRIQRTEFLYHHNLPERIWNWMWLPNIFQLKRGWFDCALHRSNEQMHAKGQLPNQANLVEWMTPWITRSVLTC